MSYYESIFGEEKKRCTWVCLNVNEEEFNFRCECSHICGCYNEIASKSAHQNQWRDTHITDSDSIVGGNKSRLKWNTFCVSDRHWTIPKPRISTHITWIQTLQRDLWAEVFAIMKCEWMCALGRRSCEYHFSCLRSPALCRHLNSKYHTSNTYLNSFRRVNLFFISITAQIPSPLFLSIVYVMYYI